MKAVVRELKVEKKRLVKALALMEKLLAKVAKASTVKKRHYTKRANRVEPTVEPKARKKPGPKPGFKRAKKAVESETRKARAKALESGTLPSVIP